VGFAVDSAVFLRSQPTSAIVAGFHLLVPQHSVEGIVARGPVLFQPMNQQRSVAVRAPVAFVWLTPVDWVFAAGRPQ
jgi:hypothetical protein